MKNLDCLRPLQAEYNDEIRLLARGAIEAEKEGRDLHDYLHETIDGHEWIIYTYQARVVLILTDNPDAYQDEMGEPAPNVEAQAYMAMMADVEAELDAARDEIGEANEAR